MGKNNLYKYYIYALMIIILSSIFSPIIANDNPIFIKYKDKVLFPIVKNYSLKDIGIEINMPIDYHNTQVKEHIKQNGYSINTPIKYSPGTVDIYSQQPYPMPLSLLHILGTDELGRDIAAQIIYSTKYLIFFGIIFGLSVSLIGLIIGIYSGYYGGYKDLLIQRFIEIYNNIPTIYIFMTLSIMIVINYSALLLISIILSIGYVCPLARAKALEKANSVYVQNARLNKVKHRKILFHYILPEALKAVISELPFLCAGAMGTILVYDFLQISNTPITLGKLIYSGLQNPQGMGYSMIAIIFSAILISCIFILNQYLVFTITKKQ